MKCDACRDNFTAYLEGDLTEAERSACAAHLASCPECTAARREFQATVSLLRSLPTVELPAGLAERITAAVHAEKLPAIAPRRARTWWELASGLAAAAGLLIGVMLWTHGAFHPQQIPGLNQPPAVQREATPPETPGPATETAAPTGTETAAKGAAMTGSAKPDAHATTEHHSRETATSRPHGEKPTVGPAPTPTPEAGGAPAPGPTPSRTAYDGGTATATIPEREGPTRGASGMANALSVEGPTMPFAPGMTKSARVGGGVNPLSVQRTTPPVAGGVQLQVLPPADCVVGEPAWISIGVTSDIQADDAQVRVQTYPGVELGGVSNGIVYRGSLDRGKTVRVPVEIIASRPGVARLRVVLHSDKPDLNSSLTYATPEFAPPPAGQAPRDAAQIEVRLAFDETPLRDAFTLISRETGVLVVTGAAVGTRPVTIDFGRGVPLPAALRILADVGGYEVVHSRDAYRIEAKHHPSHPH